MNGYDRAIVRAAMLVLAYCFPRPGECRLARWPEVDLDDAVWTVPAERTKMRREHRVPLSRQAVATFRTLRELTGDHPDKLCSARKSCARMGFARWRHRCYTKSRDSHPKSSNARSGTKTKNAIRRAYARNDYWKERIRLAQWWADYLDSRRDKQRPMRAA